MTWKPWQNPLKFLFSLQLVYALFLSNVWQLTTDDFYDFDEKNTITKTYVHVDLTIPFPHWSDASNTQIDVVNTGIVRFSGLDGLNTLDILVSAVTAPLIQTGIYTEEKLPDQKFKDKFKDDLKDSNVRDWQNFDPSMAIICTWKDVELYANKKSSFQIVLASNKNRTVAVIRVVKIEIPDVTLPYYPEMDLRYAYEGGTKFKRLGFLSEYSVPTGTKGTGEAAAKNSNSNLPGRWVFDLTAVEVTEPLPPTTTPSPVAVEEVSNSSTIGLAGEFVFDRLTLDNQLLTSENNNDEISVILAKKEADTRYSKLNTNVVAWVQKVYAKATNVSDASIVIQSYKAGSLVVSYSIALPAGNHMDSEAESKADCLKTVGNNVKSVSAEEPVDTEDMNGELNNEKTVVTDFDECAADSGQYCDRNAYCIDYPKELTYGCKCKDGFTGNGFHGNCNKESTLLSKSLYIIIGSSIACGLTTVLIIAVVCYVKKREESDWKSRQKLLPKNMQPKTNKKKGRSTRKIMVPPAYNDDFDIYHRT